VVFADPVAVPPHAREVFEVGVSLLAHELAHSLLAHELAHSIVARRVGARPASRRYKSDGTNAGDTGCHWQCAKNDSGKFDSIITNDSFDGPAYVTVNTLEFVKFSRGCTWELQQ
jgi:hypothetical protein